MPNRSYYLVNSITWYRMIAAPVLALLVYFEQPAIYAWMLTLSFCTDAIDGFLARKLKVTSPYGARLDSIADDLTLAAAIYGAAVFKTEFMSEHLVPIVTMVILFVLQYGISLYRYRKLSSFHTYLAKAAMFLQGCFLILLFLLPQPILWLFYVSVFVSILHLLEEIILVFLLPKWATNVKGIYWVLRRRKTAPG